MNQYLVSYFLLPVQSSTLGPILRFPFDLFQDDGSGQDTDGNPLYPIISGVKFVKDVPQQGFPEKYIAMGLDATLLPPSPIEGQISNFTIDKSQFPSLFTEENIFIQFEKLREDMNPTIFVYQQVDPNVCRNDGKQVVIRSKQLFFVGTNEAKKINPIPPVVTQVEFVLSTSRLSIYYSCIPSPQ